MNWLPSLLNPKAAAIAAAIAVPTLLLMYFLKLRRREMTIASTLLWKKSVQDLQVNAPFQKLRRNLLLLLQMLALAALLLALAQPISFHKPPPSENTIILLDRSASMRTRDDGSKVSRLDAAKERAMALVDSMSKDGRAMVIGFDSTGEVLQQFTSDKQQIRAAIDRVQPTDRPTRLKLAYQLADAAMRIDPAQLRAGETSAADVYVYSDGRVQDPDELSIQANVHYEKIGSDKTGNIAVVALSAKRKYDRPGEVQVFARLANFGPEPVTATIQLSVAVIDPANPAAEKFEIRQVKDAPTLLPSRWNESQRRDAESKGLVNRDAVEFTLDLPMSAVVRVEQMNKDADGLDADDRAQVVVPPPRAMSVALVTDGNPFVEKMINALGLDQPATMTGTDYEARIKSDQAMSFDVIVFDRHRPSQTPATGNFIYIGCVPGGLPVRQRVDTAGAPQFATDETVLDWKRDHPLLRGLNLRRIFATEVLKLDLPADAETILEGQTSPMIVLYRSPRAVHLIVAFDVIQSNWPLLETYPYFFFNAMQFLSLGNDMDVREGYMPGATPRISRQNLLRAGEAIKSIRLINPDGSSRSVPIPDDGDFVLPALDRVGLYRTEPSVPQYERLAVNMLDATESDVLPAAIPPGKIGQAVAAGETKRQVEWWWWLVACVAIPLLMIEWWVYTRRVGA